MAATDAIERLNRRLGLAALAVAAAAAVAAHAYLAGAHRERVRPTVPVLVAARNIPAHTALAPGMLTVQRVPPNIAPPGALANAASVAGAITLVPVYTGQTLVLPDLSRASAPSGLSYVVAAGQRAFTLPVGPTSGVGEMIHPGDHVDVLAVFTQGTDGLPETRVVTLAQDLLVLAVGQDINGQPGPAPTAYGIVTVQVSPTQAAGLAYAQARGQVELSLRSVTDGAQVAVPTVTGPSVWGH